MRGLWAWFWWAGGIEEPGAFACGSASAAPLVSGTVGATRIVSGTVSCSPLVSGVVAIEGC